jgi:hypothetical protein
MKKGQKKIKRVMKEFKNKELKSYSGTKVRSRQQAIAIAMKSAGLDKPKKRKTKVR